MFVNDAFGTAHRAHASTVGVAAHLPAAAGLLMEREIVTLGRIMRDPPHPLVAIIGGSKISTKMGVLQSLLARVDRLCIAGAMACTLFAARGMAMGRSRPSFFRIPHFIPMKEPPACLLLPRRWPEPAQRQSF